MPIGPGRDDTDWQLENPVKNYRFDLEGTIRWASSFGRQLGWATLLRYGVEEYRSHLRRGARGANFVGRTFTSGKKGA
jgi:hypothetical protein